MHVLLISPTSSLPTIINQDSHEYAQLAAMGYQPIQIGTKKELERIEEGMMQDFVSDLDLNDIN